MGWADRQWVSDDGLRCYFSERDHVGPSRLECYRRLLTGPAETKRRRPTRPWFMKALALAPSFEEALEFVQRRTRLLCGVL